MPSPLIELSAAFRRAIKKSTGVDSDAFVAHAQNPAFGDYQCNAAMGLVKILSAAGEKVSPRDIAARIVASLESGDLFSETPTIAGPGFINVRLSPTWLGARLREAETSECLDVPAADTPLKVVVDYSGPNVAKEMHVGHLRSTIIGDSLARILEFLGHEVIRQNHIGDWGTQFGMLIAHLRSRSESGDASAPLSDLELFYREAKQRFDVEEEFQTEARETVVNLQAGGETELALWRQIVDETRRHYLPVYERLGVGLRSEHERGESTYNPVLAGTVNDLLEKQVAQVSEGAAVVFVENFTAPLMIRKKDGGYGYATTDLAAIRYRTRDLQAQRIIYTHDARQSQHFTQVFDAARRAGWAEGVALEFAPFGMMLGTDNRPFKTRDGGTVKLNDLLDEAESRAYTLVSEKNPDMPESDRRSIAYSASIAGVKYSDLSKDRTNDYVFAWDQMLSLEGNTGPYLQYAYTRLQSILRKVDDLPDPILDRPIKVEHPAERTVALHLLRFGEIIDLVGRELKPHHLCTYLYDLATDMNVFYEQCPVLKAEEPQRTDRLRLCTLTGRTLSRGMQLLGIPVLDRM